MSRQPMTDKNGEVRELTREDFRSMRDPADVLPDELTRVLPKRGRPRKKRCKQQLTIRLDRDVVEFFRAHGKGWQTEINDVLLKYVTGDLKPS